MKRIGLLLLTALAISANSAFAQMPDAITAPGETEVLKAHAVGAQLYECKADASGKAMWTFREPIATLLVDGKTIGRHFAGPSWQTSDGSTIVGKATGNAPGATANDIPWLKLTVASAQGAGQLANVTTVQRINTAGGKLDGACPTAGAMQAVPYSADYIFLRKS